MWLNVRSKQKQWFELIQSWIRPFNHECHPKTSSVEPCRLSTRTFEVHNFKSKFRTWNYYLLLWGATVLNGNKRVVVLFENVVLQSGSFLHLITLKYIFFDWPATGGCSGPTTTKICLFDINIYWNPWLNSSRLVSRHTLKDSHSAAKWKFWSSLKEQA